jgi:putative hemolysin
MRTKEVLGIEDIKKLHPVFKGKFGGFLAKCAIKISGLNKVNWVYGRSVEYESVEFTGRLLKDVGVTYSVDNQSVLDHLPEGAFITVSNHAYGGLDGIITIRILAEKRPDYKMMVNWLLNRIKTMEPNFIGVNPYNDENVKDKFSSLGGVKQCISHLHEGHPLGFFPAGAVSKYNSKLEVVDREWQPSVMRLIKKAKVPVIPMYFHGHNSFFYNLLGAINWKIRTARLCHEIFNKRGKCIRVSFGEPISVEEQSGYKDLKEYTRFLREKTCSLKECKKY